MDRNDDLRKHLSQITALAEATHRTVKDFVETNHDLGALGNIRGPVPPKMEALIETLERHAREIVQVCDMLRKHPHK